MYLLLCNVINYNGGGLQINILYTKMIVIFLILGIKRYFDGQVNKIQCYTHTRAYDEVDKIKYSLL